MIHDVRSTSPRALFSVLLVVCYWFDHRYPLLMTYQALATSPSDISETCNLYLAPSTIPGAGLGIFAGVNGVAIGDPVSYGDVVVPLEGIEYHNGESLKFLWDEYTWTKDMFPGMEHELSDDSEAKVNGASPGFGAAINCLLPLVNVKEAGSWTRMSNAGLDSTSPGVGAFTPYHGRIFYATDDIPPGMELFANYGENYFVTRQDEYGPIPLRKHHDGADELMEEFQSLKRRCDLRGSVHVWMRGGQCDNKIFSNDWMIFVQELKSIWNSSEAIRALPTDAESERLVVEFGGTSNEVSDQLLLGFQNLRHGCSREELAKCDKIFSSGWKFISHDMKSIWRKSMYLQLLPNDEDSMRNIIKLGGTSYQHYDRSIRSLKWLRQHGTCIDNIKDGISNIPHAGRGAFATRNIPSGSIVAPSPLIHIADRKVLDMPGVNAKENFSPGSSPVRRQLMLNYCFGHRLSTLLLCPYGVLTWLINHSKQSPNTKLQWSKNMRHREWLERDIKDWVDITHSGLSFDFVATRDIDEGEEILVDYGDEWELAWQEHTKSYVSGREEYLPAFEMNEIVDLQLRTAAERPYELDGLVLKCRHDYLDFFDIGSSESLDEEDSVYCRILHKVEKRHGSYLAQVIWSGDSNETTTCDSGPILWDVPTDAFYFDDLPLSRDHQQPWAFRHEIAIPDELFPVIWQNSDLNRKNFEDDSHSSDDVCTNSNMVLGK